MKRNNEPEARQADDLERYLRNAIDGQHPPVSPDALEPEVAPVARLVATTASLEDADAAFVAQLQSRLSQRLAEFGVPARPRWRFALPLATAGVVAGALALLTAAVLILPATGPAPASAEAILRRAQLATASPQAAGIERLAVTQTYVSYFLGEGREGRPSRETAYSVWYEAPHHMRTEAESKTYALDDTPPTISSGVSVWDGVNIWNFHAEENRVRILRQDPARDTFSQAYLLGASGDELAAYLREAAFCRTIERLGEERVLGRKTDVIELGRASCGWAMAGSDGRRVLWIDQETGLVLKSEQYSVEGRLFSRSEIVSIQIDQPIAPERFVYTPPAGVEVRDDRDDQPLGVGYGQRLQQPEPQTLEVVRENATFPIQVPAFVPEGYELESVEHWWGNDMARELRSHADWVLLRYGDAEGNWIAISQGFGGYISGFATGIPEHARQGTVEVKGTPVTWVDGNPLAGWEAGSMLILSWPAGRLGDGWEVLPSGETLYGSPLHVGIASNALSLEEMARVANSLE